MKFERLRLQNFKCHESVDLAFDTGVTVIHGANGSGKSSLLEACFFGLYGARALDRTLDEVVTIGAEEMNVELAFTHDGKSYRIERSVRVTGGDARTTSCVLEGPEGTIEGVTDVRRQVAALLRMDTEAFVNCAYVRQGEVNKLINASPSERQDMLDDLLQLGTLEDYRERASDARVGVGRVRDDKQGALAELESQIETKSADELHARKNELETRLGTIEEEIESYGENRERAKATIERTTEILEEYADKREELKSLDEDVSDLRKRIHETSQERERLGDRIDQVRERLTAARERRAALLAEVDISLPSGADAAASVESADTTDATGATEATAEAAGQAEAADTAEASGQAEAADTAEASDQADVADQAEAAGQADPATTVSEEIDAIREELDELTEEIRAVSVEKQEVASTREGLEERDDTLAEQATEKRERADQLEGELAEDRSLIEEKRFELARLREEADEKRAAFDDEPIAPGEADSHHEAMSEKLSGARERRAELEAELEAAREQLAEAKRLREAGKCPECGQPIEESPHVEAIDEREERVASLEDELEATAAAVEEREEDRSAAEALVERESALERLETRQETLLELLGERARSVRDKQNRVRRLRAEAADHEEAAAEKRDRASELAEEVAACKEQIAEYNRRKGTLSEEVDTLEELAAVIDETAGYEEELERLREQRADKEAVNDERRERLERLRERRDELAASFDDDRVAAAREKQGEAEDYLEDVTAKLESLDEDRAAVQGEIGAIENELDALASLKERREAVAETLAHLESLYEEATDLQELYGHLRADLRQQNVETLERMLNETFDLIYESDTYARIELDGEYGLTVYQKDGETLDPDQLSGGERAIFNLSLRSGIYRLLAEGIEGTAPMPPLILDEPTVFLDADHVSKLLELIDAMYERGVSQILVVSHDEELVAGADDLVRVRKDPTTNRSSVEREPARERVLAKADD